VSPEITAIALALTSAFSWGAADFSGGMATKKNNVLGVLLISYCCSALILLVCAIYFEGRFQDVASLAYGAGAGVFGVVGLASLYTALASSPMGIVASFSAVIAASIPVLFGVIIEGVPSNVKLLGFIFAVIAIYLLTSEGRTGSHPLTVLKLPSLAGLSFGISIILLDHAATNFVLWPVFAGRVAAISAMLLLVFAVRIGGLPARASLPLVCLTGILDTGGVTFFAFATHTGRLDISAILSSMYPCFTVLLAYVLLKERLSVMQWTGLVSALVAVGLIAS
jgi:drug/metabolite transporter (DMT)-like permease